MDKLKKTEQNGHQQRLVLWTERIRQCRASGLTVKQWCGQNGITDKAYYYWMRKIKHEIMDTLPSPQLNSLHPDEAATPAFAKVLLPQLLSAPVPTIAAEAAVTICTGNLSIKIMDGTSGAMIKHIFSAIAGIC